MGKQTTTTDAEQSGKGVMVTVRMSADDVHAVDAYAAVQGITRSQAMRALVLSKHAALTGAIKAQRKRVFVQLDDDQRDMLSRVQASMDEMLGGMVAGGLRNLNQLARKVNSGQGEFTDDDRAMLGRLEQVMTSADDDMRALHQAVREMCVERTGHAEG